MLFVRERGRMSDNMTEYDIELSPDKPRCEISLPEADAVLCLSYRAKTGDKTGKGRRDQAGFSRDRRLEKRLVNVLLRVSRINRFGSEKRDFLLEGLPSDAVHALKRDDHPRIDLQTMVAEAWTWGELKNKQLAIAVLIGNALAIAKDIQPGRDLEKILRGLPRGFEERLSRESAETEA